MQQLQPVIATIFALLTHLLCAFQCSSVDFLLTFSKLKPSLWLHLPRKAQLYFLLSLCVISYRLWIDLSLYAFPLLCHFSVSNTSHHLAMDVSNAFPMLFLSSRLICKQTVGFTLRRLSILPPVIPSRLVLRYLPLSLALTQRYFRYSVWTLWAQ